MPVALTLLRVFRGRVQLPGICGAGGSMPGVRPFGGATSNLVDSDSGLAGAGA
jgi:hypothetical protein